MKPLAAIANTFTASLKSLIRAGSPCILIETTETERIDVCLEQLAQQQAFKIREWNLGYGWVDHTTKHPLQSSNCTPGLASGLTLLIDDDLTNSLVVIKQVSLALNQDLLAVARLQLLLSRIQRHNAGQAAVILVSEQIELPHAIETLTTRLPLPLPTHDEIRQLIEDLCQSHALILPAELLTPVCNGCAGLTHRQIVQVMTMLAQTQSNIDDDAITLILHEKERIIAGSGVLEMVRVHQTLADIGGLENLKTWLKERAALIHRLPAAQAFGIAAPKGVLIAGMPGCGKSLTAKVAAALLKLPLLRLDIGSLLGKYVGESEHNMRRALHLAEAISPCILWVDELEKAFVGMNSNNASEVTSRLLGFFLTWLQEKTGAVFVIATANDITALPPELLRKGRFDETFYVGFPNRQERLDILNIHLQRAGKDVTAYDLEKLAIQCRDYCGADIQNAINLALEQAFITQAPLSQQHLEDGITRTVCLRETLREQVGKYEALFEKLKLKPASGQSGLSVAQMIKLADDHNMLRREEVATSDECPHDLLAKLANDSEISVRKAVLKHPYCPESVLTQYINQFVKNEKPNSSDIELFELAVANPHTPHDLLSSKINSSLHLDYFSEPTLIRMSTLKGIDPTGIERIFTRLTKNTPTDNQETWLTELLAGKIYNKPLPHKIQDTLATHTNENIRTALALYHAIYEEAQLRLSKDSSDEVRAALAGNQNITADTQIQLATDKNDTVRHTLLKNINLCPEAQCKLDKDGNIFLAMNPELKEETQLRLLEKKDHTIDTILADHPKLTEQAQMILIKRYPHSSFYHGVVAGHGSFDNNIIRLKLAENQNTKEDVLLELITGLTPYDYFTPRYAETKILRTISQINNLTIKTQAVLCLDEYRDFEHLPILAENPHISETTQMTLAKTDAATICIPLVKQQNISEAVQAILAESNHADVKHILAAHPAITSTVQLQLLKNSDTAIRKILASNPFLVDAIQLTLTADANESIRIALAQNPNLCPEAREILKQDVYIVRASLHREQDKNTQPE
ncbi:MAG: AAA family ATPase [Marinagarivorans sp.]